MFKTADSTTLPGPDYTFNNDFSLPTNLGDELRKCEMCVCIIQICIIKKKFPRNNV